MIRSGIHGLFLYRRALDRDRVRREAQRSHLTENQSVLRTPLAIEITSFKKITYRFCTIKKKLVDGHLDSIRLSNSTI